MARKFTQFSSIIIGTKADATFLRFTTTVHVMSTSIHRILLYVRLLGNEKFKTSLVSQTSYT